MGLWRVGGVLVFMIWSFVLFPRGWAGRQRRALTIGESPEIDDDVVSVFSISSMSLFSDKFFFFLPVIYLFIIVIFYVLF